MSSGVLNLPMSADTVTVVWWSRLFSNDISFGNVLLFTTPKWLCNGISFSDVRLFIKTKSFSDFKLFSDTKYNV